MNKMKQFGISQTFRSAPLLNRYAQTDKINEDKVKNDKDAKPEPSVSSVSADNLRPSATRLSSFTSRYMTRSEDHL